MLEAEATEKTYQCIAMRQVVMMMTMTGNEVGGGMLETSGMEQGNRSIRHQSCVSLSNSQIGTEYYSV